MYEITDFRRLLGLPLGMAYLRQYGVFEAHANGVDLSMHIKATVALSRASFIQNYGGGKCFLPDIE